MAKHPKQKFFRILRNNAMMLGKIARYVPMYFVLMLAEGVIWGLLNSAQALFMFHLLNTVDGGGTFTDALRIIAAMAVFYLLAYIFDKWYWCIQNPLMKQKLHLRMHEELFVKARSLDLACFDDPEFYNDFVWAMNESDNRAVAVIEDTGKLINRTVASSTLFGILFTVDPIIAVLLFFASGVSVVCNLIANRIGFAHDKETNVLWRKKSYINRVYHLAEYAKELRIRRADDLFMKEYDENTEKIMAADRKYGFRYLVTYGISLDLVGTGTFFVLILYMLGQMESGLLAAGSFAASVTMVWRVRWFLSDLIDRLTKYAKHSLYIEKYREFMAFTPELRGEITDIPPFESLELRDVSFSYRFAAHPKYAFHEEDYTPPEAEGNGENVLRGVNLKITRGEKVAIVGYNGAGKTTLIKLIMRLYDPTEGCILYNGVDIRRYDPEAYRRQIGTVFQDFRIYAASVAENVMNGEYTPEDEGRVLAALDAADFTEKLNTLEEGIHTHLTREFQENGTNLSGGESQKIAIARVFARDYPIMIMDEPSSALDPVAEYNLNRSILEHTADKTVIFISHRLSTTRIAHRIYMFDTGSLVEAGSHEELMAKDGKYAEMFRVQSEKYRLSETEK